MTRYEYKVRPAPTKGLKGAGVKGAEARFAHGLEHLMNEMGTEGWEYVRSDILPSEERQGLTSTQTVYRSVLVFRRPLETDSLDVFAAPPPEDSAAEDVELPQEVIDAVEHPLEHEAVETEADLPEEPSTSPENDPTAPPRSG